MRWTGLAAAALAMVIAGTAAARDADAGEPRLAQNKASPTETYQGKALERKRQVPDSTFDGKRKRQFPDSAFDGNRRRQFPDSTFDGKKRFPNEAYDGNRRGAGHDPMSDR